MDENKNEINKVDNANNTNDTNYTTNTSQDYCPCCPNHCQADALECGKGRRYFKGINSGDERFQDREQGPYDGPGHGFHGRCQGHLSREDMSLEDILLHQFRACTHFFRYGMGGKTGQQRILAMLAERGIITQRELQDMLGVQSGSLSEILNKVETSGYIMRRQNEKDRRQMNLELTESGRETARNFREEHMRKARTMFDGLTEDEKKQLSSLLEKMMEHWPQMEDTGACGRGFHGRFGRRGFPGADGEHGSKARRRGGRMGGINPF
ncbi:MAG: MarR family transcriptional regulator [Clostridia bacterium]|nr:MarR family transcriptional regulator [Clostridia bacterium]